MLTDSPPARPRRRADRRPSRRGSAAAALVLGLIGALLAPLSATAAPPYATEAKIDSLAFAQSTVTSGTRAELKGTWSLPDNPTAPAGFVVDLPADLQGMPDRFPLLDATGAKAGDCVATGTQLVCDFDSAYLRSHPLGLSGRFSFWATVTTQVTEQTTVDYDFGDVTASVDVKPDPFICTEDCTFTGRSNFKSGEYQNSTDTIQWDVAIGAGATGMTGGQEVVVKDVIGANQELLSQSATGERSPSLWAANAFQTLPSGMVVPGPFAEVAASDYTVSADGTTVSFTAREGYFYNVHYLSKVTDAGAAGTYQNAAEITVGTQSASTVTSEVTRHGGSGTGEGTGVGTFTISKKLDGDTANLEDLTFHGSYVVATPQGSTATGEFAVHAGETWTSPAFAAGSTVSLSESLAGLPANLEWAAPAFSPQTVTIRGDESVAVTLTNTATLRSQPFLAMKTLAGPAKATAMVPAATRYVLEYSYPAGPGFPAGSGELTLEAGTPVSAPALPVGADVTIRERAPKPVEGITWGDPVISPERFTVGDEAVTVSVTNPVSVVTPPVVPGTPSTPLTPTTPSSPVKPGSAGGSLAITGGEPATWSALIGVLMLAAGGGLVAVRRLRRSSRQP
ncbi:DUF5979 domain-containing protein [uncultured Microbacterium sp.]|uniref:DUF5979 domain-containing protein n=1 Tax=Microbacterium algeriense TaxID=2615184 RepID=UPI0025985FAD|nr:DUF5979 domain-containing protein [uncultured Microbacterium sp.]